MKIPGFLKTLQRSGAKPSPAHNKPEGVQKEAAAPLPEISESGSAISQRKVTESSGIRYIMSKALGLRKPDVSRLLQNHIAAQLACIREDLQNPHLLLHKYPEMANHSIIYALAQKDSTQQEIKALCKARLSALKKHFSRYPVLTFLQETARWAARKVATLFSKNINKSTLQEIKALEQALSLFEQAPEAWLKKLELFENEKGLISLGNTLSAHLYFSPKKAKALQPLNVYSKSDLSIPEQDRLQLEQSRLNWLSLKLRKKESRKASKKLPSPLTETHQQTPDTIESFDPTILPKLFIETDTEVRAQLKEWQQECHKLGLSRLTYINLNQNGLIGRLFEDNPVLAEKVLETRLNNLRKDITLTFSNWLTRRRNQASYALDQLEQQLDQLKSAQFDASHLQLFLDELQQYEDNFEKKPFTLMFNMAFLKRTDTDPTINFLEVTKYTGFIDREAHECIQRKIKKTDMGDVPTAINGLYIPEEGLYDQQSLTTSKAPSVMSSDEILAHSLSAEGAQSRSPVITAGRVLNINTLLTDTLENNPKKIQKLAVSLIQPTTSELDTATLVAPLDSAERKELFYAVLENPEHKAMLHCIQKALVADALLEQLTTLEPNLIMDMLRSELNNQLNTAHHPQQADTFKYLLSLPAESPETTQKLLACINDRKNSDLRKALYQNISNYYRTVLCQYISDTNQNVPNTSTNELLNALTACDTLQLLNNQAGSDQQQAAYEHSGPLLNPKQLSKYKRLIEAEVAWRLTRSEQFIPVKERSYILACPSREAFIDLATQEKSASSASSWLHWIMSPYSDKGHEKKDADIIKHLTDNYIPALRKFYAAPFHINLHRIQQQRFRLLVEQKHYTYSEALRYIENKHNGTLIPENDIEAYKRHLKNIDVIQKASAPSNPSDSFAQSLQGVMKKVTGTGDFLNVNQIFDDIEWRQNLKELDYDYHEEFLKRTGVPIETHFQKVSGALKLGYSKIKSALSIGSSITATNQQLHATSTPLLSEQEAVQTLLKSFIDKTLNDMNKVREVARRNPALFRKTFGEVASVLPAIASQLGFQNLVGNATLLNAQIQNCASEFMGNPEEEVRREHRSLTEEDKEWIRHIQFAHDSAVRFMNLQHKFTIAKNAAVTGGQIATMASTAAVLGPAAGFTAIGLGASLTSFLSSSTTAISPSVSKAVIDNMSPQSIAFAHDFATGESSLDIAALARTAGYAAAQAPNMTSDNNSLTRLFHASKVALFHILKPVIPLKSQFNVIKKAFYEAREGKIDGWHVFMMETLPIAAIFLGSTAAAVCAGVSVFLTFGISVGVFAAALGAFAFATTHLSSALLYQKHSDRVMGDAVILFKEQLFRPQSHLAKKVKSLCMEQAQRLFSGQLAKSEAMQFLEKQELLRSYYQRYWHQYCVLELQKNSTNQKDIQQFEQQCDTEFSRWIKNISFNRTAKEVSDKVQALRHIDAFLNSSQSDDQQHGLEIRLKALNIISNLPTDEAAHFVRILRDELSEYIHLEYGAIPDTTNPSYIAAQLTQRCKEAFFGNKVRKALAATDHPELDKYETIARQRFSESHCRRIAARAENHIKAFISDPVQPLPTSELAANTSNSYDHEAFEEQVDKALGEMSPNTEEEDNDIFFDAQDHIAPHNLKSSPTAPEEFDEEFFPAPSEQPSSASSTNRSYDQIKEKLDNNGYRYDTGATELAKDLIQLQSPENRIKASMQTTADIHTMQEILGCSDENMKELTDYMFQVNFRNHSITVRATIPPFIRNLLRSDLD